MFLVVGGNGFLGSYIIKNILKICDKESDVEAGKKAGVGFLSLKDKEDIDENSIL